MSNLLKTLTIVAGVAIGIAFVSPTHAAAAGMGGGMTGGGTMNGMMGPMMGMMGGGMMGGGQSRQTMGGCGDMMQGRHQVPNSQFPRRSQPRDDSQPPHK